MNYKRLNNIAGWLVFTIALIVYYFSAERTGSLWDCGEFITGAYKLQVVHPPGAPLFLLVGRMFVYVAELFTDTDANPENIAFSVNLLSSFCTAFAAMFTCWATTILGRLALIGRSKEVTPTESFAIVASGLVAGLTAAFCTSVWFSAVEGEVYAMSTFFTCLTVWAMLKWYSLPNDTQSDRWLIFAVYATGLSIGVHLLSLLTFPALAMFYYFKKKPSASATMKIAGYTMAFLIVYAIFGKVDNKTISGILRLLLLVGTGYMALTSRHKLAGDTNGEKTVTPIGTISSAIIGVGLMVLIQEYLITGIPKLWKSLEFFTVNTLGMGFQSGIYPLLLLLGFILGGGLYWAHSNKDAILQKLMVTVFMLTAGFSTIGIVVIRANTNPPINMNDPSDPMRLLPYLNREQYGERPLLYGPHFQTSVSKVNSEDRFGQVVGPDGKERYEVVDEKNSYEFDKKTNMLFPRMSHNDEARKQLYAQWMGKSGPPNQIDNIGFFLRYQVKWMYWRYFMWNFSGRQNGDQGFYDWDPKSGNWMSGIGFIDNMILYNQEKLPDSIKNNEGRNKYYMIPFFLGLIGLFFHFRTRPKDMVGLLALFIITGLGIIVYSNQPPNEPRERDYVLVGSFIIYSMWIGMSLLGIFKFSRDKIGGGALPVSLALTLLAPVLMGTQNFDDHSRKDHSGARDYASNFLESCEKDAIVFTYGDNDTYPLWYAQEVENIRTDVRVVNLSLIAVDWYINQLRRKVNESAPIKMSISQEAYRGKKRIQIPINPSGSTEKPMNLAAAIKWIGEDHPVPLQSGKSLESFLPSRKLFMKINKDLAIKNNVVTVRDTGVIVDQMNFTIPQSKGTWLLKGDVAILDIVASNALTRPIYFAVTCRPESMLGLEQYMQLEGLALRLIPVKNAQDRQYGMVGYGRVDTDEVFENIMTKFRWGGFDKHDTFIDRSYGPSVQSIRAVIMRTSQEMLKKGDNQKAIELMDKYFASFPEYNFPYDRNTLFFARSYAAAGAKDKAKEVIEKVAKETEQQLLFMETLSEDDLLFGFGADANSFFSAKREMLQLAGETGLNDKALEDSLNQRFAPLAAFEQRFLLLLRQEQEDRPNAPFKN